MTKEERAKLFKKIIAWGTILDVDEYLLKGDGPDYPLLNKLIRDVGYNLLEKIFVSFLISKRSFSSKQEFVASIMAQRKRMIGG